MNSLRLLILSLVVFMSCSPETVTEDECIPAEREGDIILYAERTGGNVMISVDSKMEEPIPGMISTELLDFEGNSLGKETTEIEVHEGEHINYLEIPIVDIEVNDVKKNYLKVQFESTDGSQRSEDHVFFVPDDQLELTPNPNIEIEVLPIVSGYKAKLLTDVLVKNVRLSFPVEGTWSDSCFDLFPGVAGEYYFSINEYTPDLEDQLEIEHLN